MDIAFACDVSSLTQPPAIRTPSSDQVDADEEPILEHASAALGEFVHFSQLDLEARQALLDQLDAPPPPAQARFRFEDEATERKLDAFFATFGVPRNWSEVARVHLHIVLLLALRTLHEDQTPLAEIIDLAQWISSDADENVPFSFARCLQVASNFSHLLPSDAFEGLRGLDSDRAAEVIRVSMRPLIRQKLAELPADIRAEVLEAPDQVIDRLEKDPQWLNKQVFDRLHNPTLSLLGESRR
jgi:hypothetical protein